MSSGREVESDPALLRVIISELEQNLQESENEQEELLLQAATTRSVCNLLSNKLREITDEMDESGFGSQQGTPELATRGKVLEEELAATRAEKEEVEARLAALASHSTLADRGTNEGADVTTAQKLLEVKARVDHQLTDQRLLRDHIAFLQAGTSTVRKERLSAAAAMEEQQRALKYLLVQQVLKLKHEVSSADARLQWMQQAFQMLYEQCEQEKIPVQ